MMGFPSHLLHMPLMIIPRRLPFISAIPASHGGSFKLAFYHLIPPFLLLSGPSLVLPAVYTCKLFIDIKQWDSSES